MRVTGCSTYIVQPVAAASSAAAKAALPTERFVTFMIFFNSRFCVVTAMRRRPAHLIQRASKEPSIKQMDVSPGVNFQTDIGIGTTNLRVAYPGRRVFQIERRSVTSREMEAIIDKER